MLCSINCNSNKRNPSAMRLCLPCSTNAPRHKIIPVWTGPFAISWLLRNLLPRDEGTGGQAALIAVLPFEYALLEALR